MYNPIPFRVRGNRIVLKPHEWTTSQNPDAVKLDKVIEYHTNSLGFRGEEPPADLANRLSILAIGGSTTGCFMLNDGETWTDQLGEQLSRDLPTLWINNAGIDGQSTFGHLVLLQDYVVKIRPKIGIFLVGINDVALEASNWFDDRITRAFLGPRDLLVDWLVSQFELASLMQNLWRTRRAQRYQLVKNEMNYADLERWTPGGGAPQCVPLSVQRSDQSLRSRSA